MARAGAGDLAAGRRSSDPTKWARSRADLNEMLDRLSGFNQALEERVAAVTTALDRSHEERIENYRQMLVLRDALADADRLATIGQTAASVAHQVGTPLNLISGHVQLLLEQRDLDPDLARRLHLVLEQIGRVSDAIRGLLEHTRRPGDGRADRRRRPARLDCEPRAAAVGGGSASRWRRDSPVRCRSRAGSPR